MDRKGRVGKARTKELPRRLPKPLWHYRKLSEFVLRSLTFAKILYNSRAIDARQSISMRLCVRIVLTGQLSYTRLLFCGTNHC